MLSQSRASLPGLQPASRMNADVHFDLDADRTSEMPERFYQEGSL